jgi:hypothetical protein
MFRAYIPYSYNYILPIPQFGHVVSISSYLTPPRTPELPIRAVPNTILQHFPIVVIPCGSTCQNGLWYVSQIRILCT